MRIRNYPGDDQLFGGRSPLGRDQRGIRLRRDVVVTSNLWTPANVVSLRSSVVVETGRLVFNTWQSFGSLVCAWDGPSLADKTLAFSATWTGPGNEIARFVRLHQYVAIGSNISFISGQPGVATLILGSLTLGWRFELRSFHPASVYEDITLIEVS